MANPLLSSAYSDTASEATAYAAKHGDALDAVKAVTTSLQNAAKNPETIPVPPMAGDFGWSSYFQAVGVIFFILGLLALALWLLKRYGPKAGLAQFRQGNLKLEQQLSIGPKKSVVVVRFLNKSLVLGVTESNINLLTEVDNNNDAEQLADNKDFSKVLSKAEADDDPL